MNKAEFKTFLSAVPKAELHLHLEAVITLSGIKKLYKNKFGKEMTKEEQKELFSYNDLNGFIQSFLKIQGMYSSVEDFRIVFDELEKYLVKNGITYTEVFFAPTAFLKMGFKYEDMVKVFHEKIAAIKAKRGITIKLLMDVSRTFGCENAMNNYTLQCLSLILTMLSFTYEACTILTIACSIIAIEFTLIINKIKNRTAKCIKNDVNFTSFFYFFAKV